MIVHVGLDLSRKKVDVFAISDEGEILLERPFPPDPNGLSALVNELGSNEIYGVIESMTGARFIHDYLEDNGWNVKLADARKVKGMAPLTRKTDKIDARVLADLSCRNLVPEIWLPSPYIRELRETARYRIALMNNRTQIKNQIHAILTAHQVPITCSDMFTKKGRANIASLDLSDSSKMVIASSLSIIDSISETIKQYDARIKQIAENDPNASLLMTIPGVGPLLSVIISSEIGDIARFATPNDLVGYSGLCPRVIQSGNRDSRGKLTKHGPRYLRWALIMAAVHSTKHPAYKDQYNKTVARLGKSRGPKVGRVIVGRKLCNAIWYILSKNMEFSPVLSTRNLVA